MYSRDKGNRCWVNGVKAVLANLATAMFFGILDSCYLILTGRCGTEMQFPD